MEATVLKWWPLQWRKPPDWDVRRAEARAEYHKTVADAWRETSDRWQRRAQDLGWKSDD